MRCYICNAVLAEPRFNSDHDSYEPCEHCLAVIQDTLDGFLDQPTAAEDDLGGPDPILSGKATSGIGYPSITTANLSGSAHEGSDWD